MKTPTKTCLAPIWFRTNFSAPTARAKAPAMAGVLWPLSTVFSVTLSAVRFFPVRCWGSILGGRYASVAS